MKRVLIALIAALMVSCSVQHEITSTPYPEKLSVRKYSADDFCNLTELAETLYITVYVDTWSGCLYFQKGYGISPIMEPDGTVLTYDEWRDRQK